MFRKILLAALLLGAISYLLIGNQEVILAIIISAPLAFSLALLQGYRINQLSNGQLGLWIATKGNALALAGNYLLPARLSEFLKPAYFRHIKAMPIVDGISIVVVERLFDVVALVCMLSFALYFYDGESTEYALHKLVATGLVIGMSGCVLLVLRFPELITRILTILPKIIAAPALDLFSAFRAGLKVGLRFEQFVATVVAFAGSYGMYWLFLQFDGVGSVTPYQALVVFLAGTAGLTLTVTPAGIGTFEAIIIFALQSMGYDLPAAIASAMGLRLLGIVPSATIATYTIVTEGHSYFSLQLLEAQEKSK